VLRPLVTEVTSTAVAPALVAPAAATTVRADASDVGVVTRRAGEFLYVIAVRRAQLTSQVRFSGLPGSDHQGEVLFEYANGAFRSIGLANGSFSDWLGPHDARVYRFKV
jgi:hypothetical protein